MSATKHNSPPESTQDFPIVGIGASAGGLESFKQMIETIDERSGMAYVLVQHLAPSHESLLPEILSRFTVLPVHEITDDINLAPNHIYIIPENKILTAFDGVLKLNERDANDKKNRPIDVFLRSLAEVHKSFSVGVVLSGNGFDGTDGLKAIKECGGITYAQSPESAPFDSMPRQAISSGAVDFILSPGEMPRHLQHVKKAYRTNYAYADDTEIPADDEDVFRQILWQLRHRTGNDFSHYKQPTLRRRIARRMVLTNYVKPDDYLDFLRSDEKEQDALFNDILIPVSYFFRDHEIFDTLDDSVFPLLIKNTQEGENLRVWVAGCSTGEEAYSLAICLHEFISEKSLNLKVQIFASDISESNIIKARTAIYGKEDLVNVSSSRLPKYFSKTDGGYHINKDIRDMCVFAVHNFVKDPPFAKMDLITCRNVLIYFSPFLQKKALTTFHYALKKNGVLFLGKSESATSAGNLFESLIKNHKIFVRKAAPVKFPNTSYEPMEITSQLTRNPRQWKKAETEPDFQKLANAIIFKNHTPAGVIIDHNKDIVHFHGDTGPFLAQFSGRPTLNIIKMAREGLAFELRNALLKGKVHDKFSKKGIKLKGKNYLVDLEVIPIPTNLDPHFLVLFHKIEVPDKQEEKQVGSESYRERIKLLEEELGQLREDIRSVTEDQEAANEELQSANEELLSSSEEMQTLNEELETSSEELQSNNEELISVNEELMDRQVQLISARKHAEAIVETIREPLVILDRNLRVKNANHAFYKYFKTTEEDTEGRLVFELNNGQWDNPKLRALLESILPNKIQIEDFELAGDFSHIGGHILMVNARQILNGKHAIEYILMVFEDVTEAKAAKIHKESEEHFRALADTAPLLLWIADTQGKFSFLNHIWLDFTGRKLSQELGMGWAEGIHEEDKNQTIETYQQGFHNRQKIHLEFRLRRNDGEYRWISAVGIPRKTPQGEFIGYTGGCMDIHDQKTFSSALEEKVSSRTKQLRDSQNFLKSILDMTQNMIYLYDFEEEKVVFVNSRVTHSTGFRPEEIEHAEHDLYTSMIHPEDVKQVEKQRNRIRKSSDGQMFQMEYRIRNKDGNWTCQLSQGLVFKRNKKGKPIQYIGVATDITELKNANEQLLAKNTELQRSNAELASFSSIASHDLKEPLRKIQTFLKLVLEDSQNQHSDQSKGYLERVVISAFRMQQLIDDLISYSRTGSQKVKFKVTDLNHLLQEVLEDLQIFLEEQRAEVEIGKLPTISAIPSQIRQLFVNLMGNAIKYRKPEEAPRIKISSETVDPETIDYLKGDSKIKFCKITVADNGIGFDPKYSSRIFEPFQRLHGKDDYSGTGIGLAICSKILENHHGFINADSEAGKGSVFNIYVPLKQ